VVVASGAAWKLLLPSTIDGGGWRLAWLVGWHDEEGVAGYSGERGR
jgi:hypothetical protein